MPHRHTSPVAGPYHRPYHFTEQMGKKKSFSFPVISNSQQLVIILLFLDVYVVVDVGLMAQRCSIESQQITQNQQTICVCVLLVVFPTRHIFVHVFPFPFPLIFFSLFSPSFFHLFHFSITDFAFAIEREWHSGNYKWINKSSIDAGKWKVFTQNKSFHTCWISASIRYTATATVSALRWLEWWLSVRIHNKLLLLRSGRKCCWAERTRNRWMDGRDNWPVSQWTKIEIALDGHRIWANELQVHISMSRTFTHTCHCKYRSVTYKFFLMFLDHSNGAVCVCVCISHGTSYRRRDNESDLFSFLRVLSTDILITYCLDRQAVLRSE